MEKEILFEERFQTPATKEQLYAIQSRINKAYNDNQTVGNGLWAYAIQTITKAPGKPQQTHLDYLNINKNRKNVRFVRVTRVQQKPVFIN